MKNIFPLVLVVVVVILLSLSLSSSSASSSAFFVGAQTAAQQKVTCSSLTKSLMIDSLDAPDKYLVVEGVTDCDIKISNSRFAFIMFNEGNIVNTSISITNVRCDPSPAETHGSKDECITFSSVIRSFRKLQITGVSASPPFVAYTLVRFKEKFLGSFWNLDISNNKINITGQGVVLTNQPMSVYIWFVDTGTTTLLQSGLVSNNTISISSLAAGLVSTTSPVNVAIVAHNTDSDKWKGTFVVRNNIILFPSYFQENLLSTIGRQMLSILWLYRIVKIDQIQMNNNSITVYNPEPSSTSSFPPYFFSGPVINLFRTTQLINLKLRMNDNSISVTRVCARTANFEVRHVYTHRLSGATAQTLSFNTNFFLTKNTISVSNCLAIKFLFVATVFANQGLQNFTSIRVFFNHLSVSSCRFFSQTFVNLMDLRGKGNVDLDFVQVFDSTVLVSKDNIISSSSTVIILSALSCSSTLSAVNSFPLAWFERNSITSEGFGNNLPGFEISPLLLLVQIVRITFALSRYSLSSRVNSVNAFNVPRSAQGSTYVFTSVFIGSSCKGPNSYLFVYQNTLNITYTTHASVEGETLHSLCYVGSLTNLTYVRILDNSVSCSAVASSSSSSSSSSQNKVRFASSFSVHVLSSSSLIQTPLSFFRNNLTLYSVEASMVNAELVRFETGSVKDLSYIIINNNQVLVKNCSARTSAVVGALLHQIVPIDRLEYLGVQDNKLSITHCQSKNDSVLVTMILLTNNMSFVGDSKIEMTGNQVFASSLTAQKYFFVAVLHYEKVISSSVAMKIVSMNNNIACLNSTAVLNSYVAVLRKSYGHLLLLLDKNSSSLSHSGEHIFVDGFESETGSVFVSICRPALLGSFSFGTSTIENSQITVNRVVAGGKGKGVYATIFQLMIRPQETTTSASSLGKLGAITISGCHLQVSLLVGNNNNNNNNNNNIASEQVYLHFFSFSVLTATSPASLLNYDMESLELTDNVFNESNASATGEVFFRLCFISRVNIQKTLKMTSNLVNNVNFTTHPSSSKSAIHSIIFLLFESDTSCSDLLRLTTNNISNVKMVPYYSSSFSSPSSSSSLGKLGFAVINLITFKALSSSKHAPVQNGFRFAGNSIQGCFLFSSDKYAKVSFFEIDKEVEHSIVYSGSSRFFVNNCRISNVVVSGFTNAHVCFIIVSATPSSSSFQITWPDRISYTNSIIDKISLFTRGDDDDLASSTTSTSATFFIILDGKNVKQDFFKNTALIRYDKCLLRVQDCRSSSSSSPCRVSFFHPMNLTYSSSSSSSSSRLHIRLASSSLFLDKVSSTSPIQASLYTIVPPHFPTLMPSSSDASYSVHLSESKIEARSSTGDDDDDDEVRLEGFVLWKKKNVLPNQQQQHRLHVLEVLSDQSSSVPTAAVPVFRVVVCSIRILSSSRPIPCSSGACSIVGFSGETRISFNFTIRESTIFYENPLQQPSSEKRIVSLFSLQPSKSDLILASSNSLQRFWFLADNAISGSGVGGSVFAPSIYSSSANVVPPPSFFFSQEDRFYLSCPRFVLLTSTQKKEFDRWTRNVINNPRIEFCPGISLTRSDTVFPSKSQSTTSSLSARSFSLSPLTRSATFEHTQSDNDTTKSVSFSRSRRSPSHSFLSGSQSFSEEVSFPRVFPYAVSEGILATVSAAAALSFDPAGAVFMQRMRALAAPCEADSDAAAYAAAAERIEQEQQQVVMNQNENNNNNTKKKKKKQEFPKPSPDQNPTQLSIGGGSDGSSELKFFLGTILGNCLLVLFIFLLQLLRACVLVHRKQAKDFTEGAEKAQIGSGPSWVAGNVLLTPTLLAFGLVIADGGKNSSLTLTVLFSIICLGFFVCVPLFLIRVAKNYREEEKLIKTTKLINAADKCAISSIVAPISRLVIQEAAWKESRRTKRFHHVFKASVHPWFPLFEFYFDVIVASLSGALLAGPASVPVSTCRAFRVITCVLCCLHFILLLLFRPFSSRAKRFLSPVLSGLAVALSVISCIIAFNKDAMSVAVVNRMLITAAVFALFATAESLIKFFTTFYLKRIVAKEEAAKEAEKAKLKAEKKEARKKEKKEERKSSNTTRKTKGASDRRRMPQEQEEEEEEDVSGVDAEMKTVTNFNRSSPPPASTAAAAAASSMAEQTEGFENDNSNEVPLLLQVAPDSSVDGDDEEREEEDEDYDEEELLGEQLDPDEYRRLLGIAKEEV